VTTVNEAADIISGTYGRLTITYRRLTYTWTVTVYSGTLRIDELCGTFDNNNAAWREAQRIALAAHEGKTVWQIEAEKPSELALAEAKRTIDGINARMDAVTPKPVDVSDILDAPRGPSFADLKRTVRHDYTRTRVHRQDPTPAELGRIRVARDNGDGTVTVTRAPGQPWSVMKGLHTRLGGTPTYRPNSRIIDELTFPAERLAGYLTEERAA
jgi:hypothetical protein